MFCKNCGNKLTEGAAFCGKCGQVAPSAHKATFSEDRWWYRLAKVAYIIVHLPLLIVLPVVWDSNSQHSYSDYYGNAHYYGSDGDAFWYCLLTLVLYLVVLRLIKLAMLYVIAGHPPEWSKEFKRLF
jgi:uncharacterized membrane protein